MITINKSDFERKRVKVVRSYQILNTPPEKDFDDVVNLAMEICNTPIAYISIIDDDRQWFKSSKGLPITESPREVSMCSKSIETPDKITVIEDARESEEFCTNPAVTGPLKIVFYAGAPLVDYDGYPVGTICVLDRKPRKLTGKQERAMKALSRQVINALELRRSKIILSSNLSIVKSKNETLEQFTNETINSISSPLNSISLLTDMLSSSIKENSDKALEYCDLIKKSTSEMLTSIKDFKRLQEHIDLIASEKEKFDIVALLKSIVEEEHIGNRGEILLPTDIDIIFQNKHILRSVISFLLRASMSANEQSNTSVKVSYKKGKEDLVVKIQDNNFKDLTSKEHKHPQTDSLASAKTLINAISWKLDLAFSKGTGNVITLTAPRR